MNLVKNIFKLVIVTYSCSECTRYYSNWIEQIHYIHIYWNKLIDNLAKETANKLFKRQCLLSNLNPDVLNFTAALSCTKSIWKLQLMMSVADSIAKQNIYAAPDFFPIVKWTGQMVLVDWNNHHIIF